jgi:hypothetical protein
MATGVEVAGDVDTIFGEFRPGAFAPGEHLPECLRRGRITREAAAKANDRDGVHLVCHYLGLGLKSRIPPIGAPGVMMGVGEVMYLVAGLQWEKEVVGVI